MRAIRSAVLGIAVFAAASAAAQTAPPDLTLQLVTGAVNAPVGVRAPHDGSGRRFVFSQAGSIRIVDAAGNLLPTPFVTVPVTFPGSGGTSGLLGLAFHPNYGQSGMPHSDEFYIVYMRAGDCTAPGSCLGSGPDEVLERYTVSSDPNVANPTGAVVMRLADNSPPSFHNGGDIHFGPDGFLYFSVGDGGQESGTHWLAECLWKKPNDTTSTSCDNSTVTPQYFLRGKMLRIDVDNRGETANEEMCGTATGAPAEYSIPADNPFVGTTHTCDEIYLWGFRNPWRWSFDRETGDLWIGDVGQDHWEEIDLRTKGSADPIYYGWHCMEGTSIFNSLTGTPCEPPLPANVLPLLEYNHTGGNCWAVTGGYRYRGPVADLRGMYIFADSCLSTIYFAKPDDQNVWSYTIWQNDADGYGTYSGFGEDEAGNLYIADTEHDKVYMFHSDATPVTHVVTPVGSAHGAIAPDTPQTVDDGATIAFTLTPDANYVIGDVTGCGGALAGDVYTTAPVTANCEVDATFVVDPLDVIFRNGFD